MRPAILVAAVAVLAAACSDDSTGSNPTITAEMRADVAAAAGETIATDVESMSRTEATASSSLFAFAGDFSPTGCTLSLGSFVCASTFGNLDGEATLTFRDASGGAQTDYDANATASIDVDTDISGSVSRSGFSLEFNRTGSFTVTGLAGTEASRTWNGNTSTTVDASTFGGSRTYDLMSTGTVSAVVVPASGSDPRWPTSGSATTQVQFTATSGDDMGTTGTLTATVTFNGTGTVPLMIGSHEYTLNLASHTVTEVN